MYHWRRAPHDDARRRKVLFRKRLSFAINARCSLVHLLTIPPALPSETHDRPVKLGGNGQGTLQRLIRPLPEAVESIHHRSSRKPLKNGCRTFPSADFALYSISANSF